MVLWIGVEICGGRWLILTVMFVLFLTKVVERICCMPSEWNMATIAGASAVGMAALAAWQLERMRRTGLRGSLDVDTAAIAYAGGGEGGEGGVQWDKYSLIVDGRRVLLLSAEFHPWRIPDRERWRAVLLQFKQLGFNCIRIYFHWGFHSPSEGVYHFDGNRDVDFLLALCEELRLFVLAAPGPYICSETQGGGHPTWLVAKKEVRIRHSVSTFVKRYDEKYSEYCKEWFEAILPIIASHQISSKTKKGCVLALQIENENFETYFGVPLGCADDMRFLSRVARECGINVPLFHNDGWEEGSWIAKKPAAKRNDFGLDWYAYDKYVVFCPTSSPQSAILGDKSDARGWDEWLPSVVETSMDGMEVKVRGFGGCAATAPLFIAELQGGWFNHYTLSTSYDNVYDYYGEDYTRLLLDTCLAQGVTMLNYYMVYGGTNHGTLGDPDVYTSYDYSACVREFGFVSGRARKLRLGFAFARSFGAPLVGRSERVNGAVEVVPGKMAMGSRRCVGALLHFYRNFAANKAAEYVARVSGVELKGRLGYKRSFVGLGEYVSGTSGLRLVFGTLPVYVRTHVLVGRGEEQAEVWVVQNDAFAGGELAFDGRVKVGKSGGSLAPSVEVSEGEQLVSVVKFGGEVGWCSLQLAGEAGQLLILALKEKDLYTLVPTFEESFWFGADGDVAEAVASCDPLSLIWGAYGVQHDVVAKKLDLEWQHNQQAAFALFSASAVAFGVYGFAPVADPSNPYHGFPGLLTRQCSTALANSLASIHIRHAQETLVAATLDGWSLRDTHFEELPWTQLSVTGFDKTVPSKDTFDLGYTSGHVLYKLTVGAKVFQPSKDVNLKLSLNARHRTLVSLNGKLIVGGHTTYSLELGRAGSKQGPDPFRDTRDYVLPFEYLHRDGQDNVVYVIVESWGMKRQPNIFNDVRCPLGILNVGLVSTPTGGDRTGIFTRRIEFGLHVSGVDVRTLHEPFNLSGFPDEHTENGWTQASDKKPVVARDGPVAQLRLGSDHLPRWFKATLRVSADVASGGLRTPLRLRLSGRATAHVWVGGIYVARYYGNGDCSQYSFNVPETLAHGEQPVKVLVYDGREGADWVGLEVVGWEISKENLSGNLVEGGELFSTFTESL